MPPVIISIATFGLNDGALIDAKSIYLADIARRRHLTTIDYTSAYCSAEIGTEARHFRRCRLAWRRQPACQERPRQPAILTSAAGAKSSDTVADEL